VLAVAASVVAATGASSATTATGSAAAVLQGTQSDQAYARSVQVFAVANQRGRRRAVRPDRLDRAAARGARRSRRRNDNSPAMLARLREKQGGDRIEVALGDMTTTRVPGEFSVVYLATAGRAGGASRSRTSAARTSRCTGSRLVPRPQPAGSRVPPASVERSARRGREAKG
jgi:hypothetical protein